MFRLYRAASRGCSAPCGMPLARNPLRSRYPGSTPAHTPDVEFSPLFPNLPRERGSGPEAASERGWESGGTPRGSGAKIGTGPSRGGSEGAESIAEPGGQRAVRIPGELASPRWGTTDDEDEEARERAERRVVGVAASTAAAQNGSGGAVEGRGVAIADTGGGGRACGKNVLDGGGGYAARSGGLAPPRPAWAHVLQQRRPSAFYMLQGLQQERGPEGLDEEEARPGVEGSGRAGGRSLPMQRSCACG
eukprot:jgi/Botrbrau1/14809/Bobra.0332s0002.1